ncbi:Uncharacterised protein [Kingella negevensis]|uniref:Haem-binding uptake Tiki superfamily ChaN domain-containing protein n=2 Tax=Kingella negevensis TaxID=1522312 RepID=A0A238HFU1_9NEIS|nr:Uncharacterised protein [Kingella negevensis]
MKTPFLIIIALALPLAHAEPTGTIYQTATGQTLTPVQLAEQLKQADIVLIGEEHDNPQHHATQQWLLEHTNRHTGSTILEMLAPEQQQPINEVQTWFHQGGKSGMRSLAGKINWNMTWDWSQYQNVMRTLLTQTPAIVSGSPSRSELAANQNFAPQGKFASQAKVQTALSQIISNHHGGGNMVAMQQYKDFRMAQALLQSPKPAWLIAGNIHASKQLGVPLFLQDAGFSGSLKVLLLSSKDNEIDKQHADYIWLF